MVIKLNEKVYVNLSKKKFVVSTPYITQTHMNEFTSKNKKSKLFNRNTVPNSTESGYNSLTEMKSHGVEGKTVPLTARWQTNDRQLTPLLTPASFTLTL